MDRYERLELQCLRNSEQHSERCQGLQPVVRIRDDNVVRFVSDEQGVEEDSVSNNLTNERSTTAMPNSGFCSLQRYQVGVPTDRSILAIDDARALLRRTPCTLRCNTDPILKENEVESDPPSERHGLRVTVRLTMGPLQQACMYLLL